MAGIALKRRDPPIPSMMPSALPTADNKNPSITSAPMMRSLDQPIAERMPISRVRSSTAMSSVFSTISTPMRRATHAIELDTASSRPTRLSFLSMDSLLCHGELASPSIVLAMRSTRRLVRGLANLTAMKVTDPERKSLAGGQEGWQSRRCG
jgi:hypothetical protein